MTQIQTSENLHLLTKVDVDHCDSWSGEDFKEVTDFAMNYVYAEIDND